MFSHRGRCALKICDASFKHQNQGILEKNTTAMRLFWGKQKTYDHPKLFVVRSTYSNKVHSCFYVATM